MPHGYRAGAPSKSTDDLSVVSRGETGVQEGARLHTTAGKPMVRDVFAFIGLCVIIAQAQSLYAKLSA